LSVATSRLWREPPNPLLLLAEQFDPSPHPYAARPVEFASDVLGFTAWSKQREIMEAVRDHSRVAVRSSHGPGKTAIAARVTVTFLATHRKSRVITTAPTWNQVEQQLWREVRAAVAKAHQKGHELAAEIPEPTATKLELGDQWFAIGLSTNEPERFQGHHADHLLLIVDEASGVDERIYEAAEGFLTAEGSRILLLGNPTRIGGQFHRAFTTERADWRTIHITTFDTPNYTGEQVPPAVARSLPHQGWADEKRAQWGEDSPMFQVRVLGNFPSESAYSVLSLAAVEAAQRRELAGDPTTDRVTISCDVARFGDDETVIVERVGPKVRIVERYVSVPAGVQPTVHTAGLILSHARRHQPGAVRRRDGPGAPSDA
jgi:phage terminase large subunit